MTVQAGLCRTWSETQIVCFVTQRPKFHRVKCTYPGMVLSELLYICQFNAYCSLIDYPEQVDSYFNTEVTLDNLLNYITH